MNTKKILIRTLPLALVILIIVAVAVVCSVVPRSVSKAQLSDKYAGKDFLAVGDIAVSNQNAYELLTRSYGTNALVELVDTYLVQNTQAGDGKSYLEKAKADVDGLDKWISDKIFADGRAVDALADDATDEEREEAAKKDEETVANWFDVALSSYNVSTVAEIKDIYAYQYAKYLYTMDYLMDDTVYTFARDTFVILNKYLTFAVDYGKDVLDLSNNNLAELEKAAHGVRDLYAKQLFELANIEYETLKTKGSHNSKKFETIDADSISHVTFAKRVNDRKVNTRDQIGQVFEIKDAFLNALCEVLKTFGATFANEDAMIKDDAAPSITTTYASTYEKDLVDQYWAIYVKFSTIDERDNALEQIGVKIVDYIWVDAEAYKTKYDELMAAEDAVESTAIKEATEVAKLDADHVLEAMIKLYNNYNSKYTLKEGSHEIERTDVIDANGVALLNQLITDLQNGLDSEKGLTKDGSDFDYEKYNEGGSDENLDTYNFLSKFHFTYSELSNVSSAFQTLFSSTLKQGLAAYLYTQTTEDETDDFDLNRIYGPSSSANSTLVALKLGYSYKLGHGKAWSDIEDHNEQRQLAIGYIADGAEANYSTAKTTAAFNELRKEKGLIIYDQTYEDNYISSVDTAFEATKKKSKTIVAKVGDFELSADILFEKLAHDHGLVNVMTLYEQDYFIHSEWSRLNQVYDSNKGKWLEKADAYKEVITEQLENAQNMFDYYNAYYVQYGYGTMTWEEFLSNVYGAYGVKTTDDLKMYFVYQDAEERYSKRYQELGSFENGEFALNNIYTDAATLDLTSGTKSVWDVLFTNGATTSYNKMAEIDNKADWFSVSGWHVLVCVKDAAGKTVDPKEWTDAQIYYAEELYKKIFDSFTGKEDNELKSSVNSIIDSWKNIPLLASPIEYNEDGSVNPTNQLHNSKLTDDSYEYAIYKTLGLSLVCEDISAITPNEAANYDTDFVNAVKACYKGLIENEDGKEETRSVGNAVYGRDVAWDETAYSNTNGDKFVRGAFGYHIYVATNVTAYGKYSTTVNGETVTLDYDLSILTPEIIIYLARDVDHARIEDALLAKLPEDHELNKAFKYLDSAEYNYDGAFKDLVDKVRALDESKLKQLTDPASSKSKSYYEVAVNECEDQSKRKAYAQKLYLSELLTVYVNAQITKFYTPVLKDIDGTNTNYGLAYAMFLVKLSEGQFNFDSNFELVKTINLTDSTIYFVDEDGVKTALNYTARNGKTSLEFIFAYMLETITEDLTYAKEFTCKLTGVPYEAE